MTQRERMTEQVTDTVNDAVAAVGDVSQQAAEHPWIVRLGRLGFAANGFVYGLVGFLALLGALGRGGQATDQDSALVSLLRQPFGRALLFVVAVGLLGYVLWRFVQAAADTEGKGSDAKGIATRIGYAGAGLIYLGLAITTARLAIGLSTDTNTNERASLTASVLSQPFGQLLVGLAGLGIIGIGGYQLYKAYSAKFRDALDTQRMSEREEQIVMGVGRFGLAARGIVMAITGALVAIAAWRLDPTQVRGVDGALNTLAAQPFGQPLLIIVALGLIAYAGYMFAEARYRKMYRRAA